MPHLPCSQGRIFPRHLFMWVLEFFTEQKPQLPLLVTCLLTPVRGLSSLPASLPSAPPPQPGIPSNYLPAQLFSLKSLLLGLLLEEPKVRPKAPFLWGLLKLNTNQRLDLKIPYTDNHLRPNRMWLISQTEIKFRLFLINASDHWKKLKSSF